MFLKATDSLLAGPCMKGPTFLGLCYARIPYYPKLPRELRKPRFKKPTGASLYRGPNAPLQLLSMIMLEYTQDPVPTLKALKYNLNP